MRGAAACRCRPLDAVFLPLSLAGAFGLPWIALAAVLRHRWRDGDRLPLARTTANTLAGWAAGKAAKKLGFRERPCHGDGPRAVTRCPDLAVGALLGVAVAGGRASNCRVTGISRPAFSPYV